MANASTTGFGLRAVMTVGNTPATSGQSEYKIQTAPGVASNKGDPMSFNDGGATAGDAGKVQDASFTVTDDGGNGGTAFTTANSALLIGVFNGAFFVDSNGKPTFSNNVVASQATSVDYNTGSDDITAFIIDNPLQEYVVKADAALAQTLLGVNPMQGFNTNNYTAEFINKNKLQFAEGNAIKYICRHAAKGQAADIEKAIHYLEMILERDYEDTKV